MAKKVEPKKTLFQEESDEESKVVLAKPKKTVQKPAPKQEDPIS
jgi:hypothetical protein